MRFCIKTCSADSIETIMSAQWYDALVAIPGCDKNMPGCLMAMGRLNRPAIMVYGGTIKPGFTRTNNDEQKRDIVSAFQCYGEFLAGRITEEERKDIVRHSCPGAGACGGMYTANTMASAIEAMGRADVAVLVAPPLWVHVVLVGILALLIIAIILPMAKAYIILLEHRHRQ